ncbi:hypothetical protein SAMN04515671_4284 [Nakamurella panacisegetis]|uniref:Uncharacterized protein n=1 Tax=Nakamurella panacisegetis TaxID=1090615 RepID=A0A1H0STH5_9ACTN|nr:hypothetical protein [Nakamurella panacisegetis]SDP45051.1 hypothetical protein SAMN04515671_4284 [Nakamurella panacisegetis]
MMKILSVIRERRLRREQYRNSIEFAIANAATVSERNELIVLAGQQGVFV